MENGTVIDWDKLVREHGPVVFGTAWRILGHAADAEDVTQEVFLEAYQWPLTRPVRSWGGLLRRLSACRALDRLRQRKNHAPLDGLSIVNGEVGPEEELVGRELAERLRESISLLPPREGTVFCLRYFDDLSYQEIADLLTITPGAVAAALCKARAKLERLLLGTTDERIVEREPEGLPAHE
jgi:RNA polymerase sigma-70 factor (ECF subfamily)